MPHYHFNLADGSIDADPDGVDLPDLIHARIEAVRYLAATLSDRPDMLWPHGEYRVEVTDSKGLLLFVVTMSMLDAPATGGAGPGDLRH
ncbi:MAG TPA: hypothetical protein VF649_14295 [Sphingomonas sp.]|uniref:DUF6894 family protein n=1 Tax=Sphingomonas sp. TaxID=28214 RepID=UPI002EDB4CA4